MHDRIQDVLKSIDKRDTKSNKAVINFDKLSDQDKVTVIAEYDGGKILVGDLFADRKRSPTNKEEFLARFKSISQQHLLSKHAKELDLQNEHEAKNQLQKMKSSLLRTILYQRLVKDKVNEFTSFNSNLSAEVKVKQKTEYEKTLRSEFENKLKSKYKFKFETDKFEEALKLASLDKEIQNSKKVTK